MRSWVLVALLPGLSMLFAPAATASRAEIDGRGLPRLLAVDPSTLLLFPGSAAQFGRTALVDYSEGSSSPIDFSEFYYLASLPPLVAPVTSGSERFAMALTGKHLAFGYVLDGPTHNLVLSHEAGWGASLGISDVYDAVENSTLEYFNNLIRFTDSNQELSRRDLRLTLGWAGVTRSGRVNEIALGGNLVSTQQSTYFRIVDIATDIDTTTSASEWKSEPGFGFDVRLRTLSPQPGFQAAIRFAYEDLQPEVISGDPPTLIRRYGLAQLGWRMPFEVIDEVMAGVVLEWIHDTFQNMPVNSPGLGTWEDSDNTRYFGQIFASAEHRIGGRLVGRAGVRGSAYFQKQKLFRVRREEADGTDVEAYKRTKGAILRPEFFLGIGWSWKDFTLDGRIRENISLTSPVSQWSVSYSW